jgi:hypothetical protein
MSRAIRQSYAGAVYAAAERAETLLIWQRVRAAKAAGKPPDPRDVRRVVAMATANARSLGWRSRLPASLKKSLREVAEELDTKEES